MKRNVVGNRAFPGRRSIDHHSFQALVTRCQSYSLFRPRLVRDHPSSSRLSSCNAVKQFTGGRIEDQKFAVQIDRHHQTGRGDDNPGNHRRAGLVLPANLASVGIDCGNPTRLPLIMNAKLLPEPRNCFPSSNAGKFGSIFNVEHQSRLFT